MRAMKSVPPPGAEVTMMRTGFVGYCCAEAGRTTAAARANVNSGTARIPPILAKLDGRHLEFAVAILLEDHERLVIARIALVDVERRALVGPDHALGVLRIDRGGFAELLLDLRLRARHHGFR